jgi:hypothetical protein
MFATLMVSFGYRLTLYSHSDKLLVSRRKQADVTDRIGFITHQGKQILLIDVSNCSAADVEKTFRAVPEFVTTRPRGSVFILTDFTGASFDLEAIRVMKETAVFDKSFVRKSAWVGTADFPQVFSENLKNFARREFPAFKTREAALAWLAED